jgi:hypothetical protein
VVVLEGMWNLTSIQEKEAIIKDLQYFLAKEEPSPSAEEASVMEIEEGAQATNAEGAEGNVNN